MAEQRWCGPVGEHHAGAGVFVREVAGAMQQVDGAQHLAIPKHRQVQDAFAAQRQDGLVIGEMGADGGGVPADEGQALAQQAGGPGALPTGLRPPAG